MTISLHLGGINVISNSYLLLLLFRVKLAGVKKVCSLWFSFLSSVAAACLSELFIVLTKAVFFFQVKAQQAQVIRILDSKSIQYELIDISVGGEVRNEMRTKAGNPSAVPPQLFNEDQYCGVSRRF